ncbi:MAG: hypothetical protein E7302_15055 [Butyrivibrio sp.]|nr:hypothetical protein [Butyrivibrio sp.]
MKNLFAKVRFMAVLIGIIAAFMIFICTRPSREKQIVAFVEENELQLTDIVQNMMDGLTVFKSRYLWHYITRLR